MNAPIPISERLSSPPLSQSPNNFNQRSHQGCPKRISIRIGSQLQYCLFVLQFTLLFQLSVASISTTNLTSSEQMRNETLISDPTQTHNHVEKQKALHTIRKVLENYSDDAIRRILGSAAISPSIQNEENSELAPVDFMTTPSIETTSTPNDHKFHDELEAKLKEEDEENAFSSTQRSKTVGVMRIRADIRSSSSSTSAQKPDDERPLNRHYRSARNGDWLQHHKRRRKGCPPLHGRDQLLCPSRNTHRYDVCISREQLCDHVVDCPGGEDEDMNQCFFYKPLDDQLKTLSHAVLLLVDNIMAESQQRRQEL